MKLYQPIAHQLDFMLKIILILSALLLGLSACGSPQIQQDALTITVQGDGVTHTINVPAGSTARTVLQAGDFTLKLLDRSEPPLYTVMTDGATVVLTRVVEEFLIEESIIPFSTELLKNESLPEGERRLIQSGVNGVEETTIRQVLENGVEVSRSVVKRVVVKPFVPEIMMVGSQSPFAVISLSGTLAYLSAGNAWVMHENTGFRQPVVTTGDLDGRIFSVSPDNVWLMYSRSEDEEEVINSLWVTRIDGEEELTFFLDIYNVIHFADWVPGSINGIVFSTAESNPSPPGWQANNEIKFLNFSANGWVSQPRLSVNESSGGVYGWWGTNFSWSPNGEELA
ncbi:MAG: G5 domain-containing protein, partial [Chloroflexota bacterium]